MMPGEYRRATDIVGSLGLALIGANGVLILVGSSAGEYHPGQSDWWASLYQPCAVALAR